MTRTAPQTRRPDAGVTLIETLVVLAIIGTAVGAAMLAIPRGTEARPVPPARRGCCRRG